MYFSESVILNLSHNNQSLTLTMQNLTKLYRDYLHKWLCNHPRCNMYREAYYVHIFIFPHPPFVGFPPSQLPLQVGPKKKKLLYWRNPTDPKIRPDPTFFFLKTKKKKKRQKNDRPILKKAKPVIFLFKHLILALKMLIWGFETWLVA